MKKRGLTFALAGLLLGGCNMSSIGLPGLGAREDVRLLETSGEGFGALLAQEYQNLAVLEEDFMDDPQAAAHYAEKANNSARGAVVWPDNPTLFKVPQEQALPLAQTYNMLLDALEQMSSEDNANLLALAQTRYDCWLERAAEGREEAEVSICRDMVTKALGMMTVPSGSGTNYTVSFPDDETILDDTSMQVIETAASSWQDRPYWEVLLVGHAAAKGDRDYNKTLSMRRAVAVRNLLAQQGIDPDEVTIVAHTDTREETNADVSRQVDIRFEPVYLMKEGPVYDSLEALGAE
ncbi:MAG: OmpA family protein [Alphaproteobacteria bacterium]|nr:OmpA family protein [Alphaproteobacteria bacterium]